jgi:hypothetical protein
MKEDELLQEATKMRIGLGLENDEMEHKLVSLARRRPRSPPLLREDIAPDRARLRSPSEVSASSGSKCFTADAGFNSFDKTPAPAASTSPRYRQKCKARQRTSTFFSWRMIACIRSNSSLPDSIVCNPNLSN